MAWYKIADLLGGAVPVGTSVTVKGWVRTRRDSKAGLSFLHVHDGSCFDPIQAVVPATLANYQAEVVQADSRVLGRKWTGTLVASQGKGQAFEIQADSVASSGWVEDPETYPISPKRHTLRVPARGGAPARRAPTRSAPWRASATRWRWPIHRFFHEHGFYWMHTPIITASDAEGAGELFRVSTLDLANLPRTPEGQVDFTQDFFGKQAYPHRLGPAQRRDLLPGAAAASTRSGRPSARRTRTPAATWPSSGWSSRRSRSPTSTTTPTWPRSFCGRSSAPCSTSAQDDMAFFAERVRQGRGQPARSVHELELRADGVHGGDRRPARSPDAAFEFPVRWGMDLQAEHERYSAEEYVGRPVVVIELSEGDQGVLHALERRRADRGGDGRAGARHRRDHRRQPARGTARRARPRHRRDAGSIRSPTGGIATCGDTARCRTRASAWASSGPSATPRAWPTSATSSRSRARRRARSSDAGARLAAGSWQLAAREADASPCRRPRQGDALSAVVPVGRPFRVASGQWLPRLKPHSAGVPPIRPPTSSSRTASSTRPAASSSRPA